MVNKNLYWTAYYKLGRSYALSKKWKEAKKVYFDLLKRDPENISVRMSLAYITAMEGDLDSAEEIYKSLWNNNSDNSEILVNYINVLIANNNVSEAKNLIKTLKEKFQENKNIESFEKKIEELDDMKGEPPMAMLVPLMILAFLAIILGVLPNGLINYAAQIAASVL